MKANWGRFVQETVDMILPKELATTDYANGHGYIQLSLHTHARFLLRYREVVAATMPDQLKAFDQNPAGFVGRYLDDAGSPAYVLWNRAACIDSQLRMWGQPFFAANPNQAPSQVCLATV